jgi:outer membrane protein TolC
MKKIKIIRFAILFLIALNGQAQTNINLRDAILLSMQNSKQLKITMAKSEIANMKEKEIINLMLPRVSLGAEYRRLSNIDPFSVQFIPPPAPATVLNDNIPNTSNFRLSFYEPLFTGLRGFTALRSNQLLVEAAKLDIDKDKTEIYMNVVNTYYNMYKIMLSQTVLEESFQMVESRLKDVNALKKNGMATQNDLLKVELQKSNIELNQMELMTNKAIANFNFNILLGLPDSTVLEIDTTELYATKENGTLYDFLNDGLINRSDLKAQEIRSQVADNAVKIQKGNYYPQFYMSGNYLYANPNQRIFPPEQKFNGTWDFGVGFTWDITGLYINKNLVNIAEQNAFMAKTGTDGMEDLIKIDINQAFLVFNQSKEKIKLNEKAVAQSKENQRMATSKFKNQLATISEVLEADLMVIQSEMNLANAKIDAELAYYRLLRYSGKLK